MTHLSASYSDHDPILLDTTPASIPTPRCRHKLHRFEERWVSHPECEQVIRNSWTQSLALGSHMNRLFEKIKQCRADLVAWSQIVFGNTRHRLNEKQQELEDLVGHGYGQNLHRITELKRDINTLLHHEEVYWRQRSRSLWLKAGDKNTRFFHRRASQRHIKNMIEGLKDRDGVWQSDPSRVSGIAEEYYTELFTTSHPRSMERVLEAVDKVVTEDMANFLTQPYSEEEVRVALFSMHPSKAPEPDGMSPFFF